MAGLTGTHAFVADGEPLRIGDASAMRVFGRSFAERLRAGDVVLLHGDLGAGKTTLTQGIAEGLAIAGPIQSPTFTIVSEHQGVPGEGRPIRLYHLDLYRLDDPADLDALGYDQYLMPEDGVSVIEWPERAGDWLPPQFWLIRITHDLAGGRIVTKTWHDSEE